MLARDGLADGARDVEQLLAGYALETLQADRMIAVGAREGLHRLRAIKIVPANATAIFNDTPVKNKTGTKLITI